MKRSGCRRVFSFVLLIAAALAIVVLHSTEWLASLGGRTRRTFRNTEPTRMATGSFLEMMQRQFFGDEPREPAGAVPVVQRRAGDYATPPRSGLRATWMGWSSVLVEIDGRTILTDPVWSERCSPSTIVGPKRFHRPPIAIDGLPHIDAVVISHDHYDHLDMATIRALGARGTHFAVPAGVGAHLRRWKIAEAQIHELEWNQTWAHGGLAITATPARHYSGRNPLRPNETLWSSWVVKGPRHRIFFSGDTGYSAAFRTIGIEHGPFDLTLIKIGASDPTWSEIHMTPEEAVATHRDVRGQVMLPVHWATFNLAFHAWREPAERAVREAAASGVRIVAPRPGELVEPSNPSPLTSWWATL
ncbi:MAG TPA: MBL fold metallo-hydrolase [Thermoanaerobaculia bacterium]|nr:MBL fold metallo-hydrolase [Thermoanaerobaculia bacterium]